MELNKVFEVITGDESLISDVIQYYNKKYGGDFEILYFDDRDGVIFAIVKYENSTINDIFQLGCIFGMRIEYKRKNGEIDW